ncbi:MAG: energy transducer TonB [Myxococcales bacterium]|nr:energy transducer TonB [Myxococcales bacterium]
MFAAASRLSLDPEREKRLVVAALAAIAVLAGFITVTAVLGSRAASVEKEKTVDVAFRPPPPPPPPAKIDNPPPPPPVVKKVSAPKPPVAIEVPVPVAAPAPAAAAMVAPKEVPKVAPPESTTAVAAIAVAVGGTGNGMGTAVGGTIAPSEDDSPAPVEVKAAGGGPVNIPEEADPPEPDENNPAPEYPEAARTTGQEARVVLKVVVEKTGAVGRIQVLKGEEPFVAAAIAAVKAWRFTPALLDAQPIAVFLTIPVKFSLRE